MTGRYQYIDSYAVAEGLGLKGQKDGGGKYHSIVSSVVDTKTGKIVGYTQGHGFSRDAWDRLRAKDTRLYQIEYPETLEEGGQTGIQPIHATNDQVAKILAARLFKEPYSIVAQKKSLRRIRTVKEEKIL